MDKTFTVMAHRHQRHPQTYEILLNEKKEPIIEGDIGSFTFRVPTVRDNLELTIRRQQLLSRVGNPAFLTEDFFLMAEASAHFPYIVESAPPGWDWDNLYSDLTLIEVYHAYKEGLAEVRKKNPTAL